MLKPSPFKDRYAHDPFNDWGWASLADHVGDHVVLSPERAVLVTSLRTKSSYPRPPQSLNPSHLGGDLPWDHVYVYTK